MTNAWQPASGAAILDDLRAAVVGAACSRLDFSQELPSLVLERDGAGVGGFWI